MTARESFDYIVVGAGSAGAVIANRLSADPTIRVALIEAGESDRRFPSNLKTLLPFGNVFLLSDSRFNWQYAYDAAPEVAGREINCPLAAMGLPAVGDGHYNLDGLAVALFGEGTLLLESARELLQSLE